MVAFVGVLAGEFGAHELADEEEDDLPLLIEVLSELAGPLEHGLHQQVLLVDRRPLNLLPNLLYSAFDEARHPALVGDANAGLHEFDALYYFFLFALLALLDAPGQHVDDLSHELLDEDGDGVEAVVGQVADGAGFRAGEALGGLLFEVSEVDFLRLLGVGVVGDDDLDLLELFVDAEWRFLDAGVDDFEELWRELSIWGAVHALG